MKRLISTPTLAAMALTLGALVSASSAYAHSDVSFTVGVQVPGVYVQPAPVYVPPPPIYRPVPIHYVHYEEGREGRRFDGPHWHHRGPWGDFDRDGVPNRFDHAPNNPYRR